MKPIPFIVLFCVLFFPYLSQSQSVLDVTYECLPDYDKYNGEINPQKISKDTIRISMKSYGPCDVDFDVSTEVISGVYGGIILRDKNAPKTGETKVDCACMYQIDFLIVGMGPVSKGWAISNKTMSSDAWEEWYWEHKE